MIRFFVQTLLSILANALGLITASLLLDDFSISGVSFVFAVIFFTFVTAILGPFITKLALTNAPFLMGGIALVTTFIGLLLTQTFTDGIEVSGLTTWAIATLVVWLFSVIANVVLPLFLFKKVLNKDNE